MIIDTSQENIEVFGDIKEFKTSIDPKNLEYITTLLSSNLYSDPEQSFIREIVSNAWDSHVEAGTTDVPVIIRFKNELGDKSVTIRDFGTGLSPERFKEVYCNIGSSTKRESNEFIGGFGIGKYSSLACSNTVYITSYYEGTAYQYIMVKSGNSITTNLVLESYTEERNGVEVTIKSIRNLDPYYKALDYVVFFPNIYVDGESRRCKEINEAKLKKFVNFAAATKMISHKLLLGNVLYPCNTNLMPYEAKRFFNSISNTGIVIKFDVGEINITPNRESIIYTSETIEKIANRAIAAEKELKELTSKSLGKDYTDIREYHAVMSKTVYYEPVEDVLVGYGGYQVRVMDIPDISITFRGKDLKEDVSAIGNALHHEVVGFKGVVSSDKIYTKKLPYSEQGKNTMSGDKFVICSSNLRLLESIRMFLRGNYCGYAIISEFDKDDLAKYIEAGLSGWSKFTADNRDLIITGLYDSIMSRSKKIDFNTDPSYLKFKDDLAANKVHVVPEKSAILYTYEYGYRDKYSFRTLPEAVEFIKEKKSGIVLLNMDIDERPFLHIAKARNLTVIKARKDIVADLKDMNLSCMVDPNWLFYKDPYLDKIHTVMKYFPEGIRKGDFNGIMNLVPLYLLNDFTEIKVLDQERNKNYEYSRIAFTNGKIDPQVEEICRKLKSYISKYKEASSIVGDSEAGYVSAPLTAAVIMKTKSFRIRHSAYEGIKGNKLINILCRK